VLAICDRVGNCRVAEIQTETETKTEAEIEAFPLRGGHKNLLTGQGQLPNCKR